MRTGFSISAVRHVVCLTLLLTGPLALSLADSSFGDESGTELPAPDRTGITLTDEERAWLRDHPVITLAHDPAWPPMEFSDENGEITGMAGDYVKLVEQRLGVKFIRLRNLSWQEAFARQKRWEIDMATCVAQTPQRTRFWAFTTPYMTIPIVIATQLDVTYIASMKELYGKTVALVEGYAIDDRITNDFPQINLIRVKDPHEGFAMLQRGDVFAYIDNLLIIGYYQAKMKVTNLKIAGETPYINAQCMAVRKDWAPLAAILDKALNSISESERMAIHNKWLPLRYEVGFNYRLLWQVLAGCAVIFLVLLFWNRKLAREIQLRTKAEELLRKSEERFRLTSESIPSGLMIVEHEEPVYINKRSEEITGYSSDELRRMQPLDLIFPEDRPALARAYTALKETGCFPEELEFRIVRKDGAVRYVRNQHSLNIRDGKIIGRYVITTDITERKRLEGQLLQSQKMEAIGTLAGGIAHDFNNILGAIIGFAELSKEKLPKDSPVQHDLAQILKASTRATDLVKQILAFSRKNPQEHKPVQLGFIIEESVKLLRATLPTTIEIRQHIIDQPFMINADPTQMHQLLMNLCTNAAQAMSAAGGILEIDLKPVFLDGKDLNQYPDVQQGHYLELTVRDTGPGIDPSIIDRIFDPYFTTKETGKGTGMGLAVVHGIVKDHGGVIRVSSEKGKGTLFHVLLPAMEKIPSAQSEEAAPVPTGSERILFVDDEASLVNVGQELLESLGYTVTVHRSSLEALEAFRKKPSGFDLVITDQTMPHMTGDMLAKKIMEIRPDIPIILCTGYSDKVSEETAQELGIKAFVIKPLSRHKIAGLIRRVLEG